MWLTEEKCSMPLDEASIASSLGIRIVELERILDALKGGASPLIEDIFCLDRGMIIVSIELKEQIDQYRKWESKEIESVKKRKREAEVLSLSGFIKRDKAGPDVAISYVLPKDRHTEVYSGWFPTVRFDESGQVYNMRKAFLAELKERFSTIDVDAELRGVFSWLMKNKERRKSASGMNFYITCWLERARDGIFSTRKSGSSFADDLDRELDALFEEREGNC